MATPDWVKKELRSNFARASRAGRRAAKTEPRAARATYLARGGRAADRADQRRGDHRPGQADPGLKGASPSEVGAVEVLGRGGGLHWERLDLDLSVPALVSSVFAGREWMAELGRVGGRRSSAAKAAAARRNGHKGGRPRVHVTADTDV